jgi:hypothetical protein
MDRVKVALFVLLFVLLFGIAGRMDKEDAQRVERAPYGHEYGVEEDTPFWNCATYGNYHC